MNTTTNMFSSFWADTDYDSRRTDLLDDGEKPVKRGVDHVQLASYRRAISNFVNIVTNRSDIPVRFQTSGDSYTDGKIVNIGSKINEKNFDSIVGLALHEGSHIKLSNFELLKNLDYSIPEELFRLGEKKGLSRVGVTYNVKSVLNYVEDRRIDYYVFTSSPGYKGYYHTMYDKYFHSKHIDKALQTDEYTELDIDSYMFRLINLTNKNADLTALPNLKKIYSIIFKNKDNIKTIKSTDEALSIALEVINIIFKNIETPVQDDNGNKKEPGKEGESGEGNDTDGTTTISDEKLQEMLENGQVGNTSGQEKSGKKVELTERQKKMLDKAFEKQKDFVNGDAPKTGKLSKKDSGLVRTMEEAGVTYENAGEGIKDSWYGDRPAGKGTKVVLVKKLTRPMIEERVFPSLLSATNLIEQNLRWDENADYIKEGIRLGTKLGKKLQVRGESRDTKWSRLDSGRIDKRLVAELGFGNSRVFQTTFTESYSDAILHISVDASGSMNGEKWTTTMTSVVAITKACSMIQNVDVIVSFRSTHETRGGRGREFQPIVLIAYDSRVDNFNKVKRDFANIHAGGTTPEGLCFEVLLKDFVPSTTDRDSYFLNFSDGMPMFSNKEIYYTGDTATEHTNTQVKKIRQMGIKVLSYFVSGGRYDSDREHRDFKTMYGRDAQYCNITNVLEVAKTMNKKFLEK